MEALTFSHGVHPPEYKEITEDLPIKRLPFPPYLVILLSQHAGKPARPIVREGQDVTRGQLIAEDDGFISAPIHAPATGVVRSVSRALDFDGRMVPAIILEPYPGSRQTMPDTPVRTLEDLSPEEIVQGIKASGMVGLGGAAFPTHVKFSPPPGKEIEYLIVNGCECEPYLTSDYRVMLENSEDMILGIKLALKALGAKEAIIGIETNKPQAIELLSNAVKNEDAIRVQVVETKYPQGAEKMLTKALLNREIPSGGLPADAGVMISNSTTLAEIGDLIPRGHGLVERAITVSGNGIERPGNYLVPVGTPLNFLLETLGLKEEAVEVVFGGPMMGKAVTYLEIPITKGVSGILVLTEEELGRKVEQTKIFPCIRCAACVSACPIHLNPSRLGLLAACGQYEQMVEQHHLLDCFECGCCSYVCPSNIPLVQQFRIAKTVLRERRAKA